jgi:hypothetical protein
LEEIFRRAELVLYGKFVEVPDTSFFRRMFEITAEKYPSPYDRMIVYESGKTDKLSFPYWWLFTDFLAAIYRAPISVSERLKAAKRLISRTSVKKVAVTSTRLGRD